MGFLLRPILVIATSAMLAATGVCADAPAATLAPALLEHVVVREGPTPGVELHVSADVQPVARSIPAHGDAPPRVYLDLPGTKLGPAVARESDGAGAVRKIRTGQFDPKTARVVIELREAHAFDVQRSGSEIVVTFAGASKSAAKAAAPAKTTTAVKPSAPAPAAPAPVAAAAQASTPRAPATPAVKTEEPAPSPKAETPAPVARKDEPLPPSPPAVRPIELQEKIARRYANEDWPGIVALYGANTELVRRDVDATTRAAVVDALREMGLAYSAKKLLGPPASNEAPSLRVARAQMALASGDVSAATAGISGLDEAAVDPALVPPLRTLKVRLALARGDIETASAAIGNRAAPELRAEIADDALRAGRAATERHVCASAVVAYQQALDADGGRTARAAAGAGLVRAALVCQNPDATMTGLGVLAESSHPLLRRAATVLAATRVEDKQQARVQPARREGG